MSSKTKQSNYQDMVALERNQIGKRHSMAKLNEQQVRVIRACIKQGESKPKTKKLLAEMMGCTTFTIKDIINRYSWRHI